MLHLVDEPLEGQALSWIRHHRNEHVRRELNTFHLDDLRIDHDESKVSKE